jgi:maltooligosyltrehalose trehalohydrolase
VHEPYGGPAAYQRLVDACHRAGIGVVQDVVYNHFGPSGNYLPRFGPYLKEGRNTWGDLVNLDGEGSSEVRRLILDNALMWLRDFHVDGLRLDAVHALHDDSEVHLLEELAIEVADLSAHQNRPLTLIAESDLNDTRMVTPREAGGYGLDAQWSDDFHHAVHVAITGETDGYYADFAPLGALAKVLDRGFFHDGTFSSFRGRDHGRPVDTDRMPAWRLVVCAQNHDQVGNRARGDRTAEHLDPSLLLCGALLTLAAPFTPMLFQGEEWAAGTPFAFFTSHPEPELAKATAEGRLAEFEQMGWKPEEVLDPQDPETFERSRLRWDEVSEGRHATVLAGYRRLAELRRELSQLTDPRFGRATVDEDRRRLTLDRGAVAVHLNLGEEAWSVGADEVLFSSTDSVTEGPVDGAVEVPPGAGLLVAAPGRR